ncbi:hypothetical protein AAFF_G00435380 [Aldrovandia affinis]|uniref:Uncharacterized protein n=1 Tax=Aldrovandia affinis TaxID=143900 RepID=A0AAD7S8G6_9TELE|nr:hypothetical protein AAFF_G00435380 [Aldrovandia affinis]
MPNAPHRGPQGTPAGNATPLLTCRDLFASWQSATASVVIGHGAEGACACGRWLLCAPAGLIPDRQHQARLGRCTFGGKPSGRKK